MFEPPPVPVAAARRRPWLVALVAVVALLVGVGAASAVILGLGIGQQQPTYRFSVSVFLKHDATAEQKSAVRSALEKLNPVDGVHFESRDEAWKKFQETFKDHPDLVRSTKPESLPESFRLETRGRDFDCAQLVALRTLPGVDDLTVGQYPTKGHPGASIAC